MRGPSSRPGRDGPRRCRRRADQIRAARQHDGRAGVKTHLQALHYKDVRDLRRGYDGQWTGKATQGNVPKTVTIAPDGTVTAR